MNELLDGGDIICQTSLDLTGNIDEIFCRIEKKGYQLTKKIIKNGIQKTFKQSKKMFLLLKDVLQRKVK